MIYLLILLFQKAGWEEISARYNGTTTQPRTAKDLRQKFESLKRETRKDIATRRNMILKTGGGPKVEIKCNPIIEIVKEILQKSSEGLKSSFDCDKISRF